MATTARTSAIGAVLTKLNLSGKNLIFVEFYGILGVDTFCDKVTTG